MAAAIGATCRASAAPEDAAFTYLRDPVNTTDGNLATH